MVVLNEINYQQLTTKVNIQNPKEYAALYEQNLSSVSNQFACWTVV